MSEVKKFYAGKNVLLTGATGFIGKVFLEKLLYECDQLNSVYLIIRPKNGVIFQKRCEEFYNHVIFNRLRNLNPTFSKKIRIFEGDVDRVDLGLSAGDRQEICEHVTVVIHNAANVRFDLSLKSAINSNAVGTLRMLELARQIERLEVFIYVSTAYSQAGLDKTAETYYPAPIDPYLAIKIAAAYDNETLYPLLQKMLGDHINTYTFSKAVSEDLAYRYHKYYPIVVVRPSVGKF